MSAEKVIRFFEKLESEKEKLDKENMELFDYRYSEYIGTEEQYPEFKRRYERVLELEEMEQDIRSFISQIPELTIEDIDAYESEREKQKHESQINEIIKPNIELISFYPMLERNISPSV